MMHMTLMQFEWQKSLIIFQNVNLESFSNIGILKNSRKCVKQMQTIEKKLMNPHTADKKSFALVRNKLEKDKETISSKDLFVVTRTRKLGHLYKSSNEDTTKSNLSATTDGMQQMQERIQKMEIQMEEQKKIVRIRTEKYAIDLGSWGKVMKSKKTMKAVVKT
uniref:Uncharacterized protein n=1 Tax=Solanum lycopersicum TaxID=4081 RepID=A0A3Q7IEW4_SOLLC